MENSLKKRVLGTRRGFYGLLISVVSIIALCWMLYARDDARAEYEQLKADGTCFADKAPDSWKDLSYEEQKKIARKCMAAQTCCSCSTEIRQQSSRPSKRKAGCRKSSQSAMRTWPRRWNQQQRAW